MWVLVPYVKRYYTHFKVGLISVILALLCSFLFLLWLGRNPAPAKHLQGGPSRKKALIKAAKRNLNDEAFNSAATGKAA